ncbi:MAG: hypothetical protein CL920_03450 [Deltaproteobacteria bacterium]|nr:hypothetical protein [Deltaproteobacteria bacterium]
MPRLRCEHKKTHPTKEDIHSTRKVSTMKRPPGLKLYPALLSSQDIHNILQRPELPQSRPECPQLFRLFGDFGGKEASTPSPWMLEWGTRLQEQGFFSTTPNQYRLCDWIGDLSAQFKWHIDNKRHGKEILVISLTDQRRIGFRPPTGRGYYSVELNAGDAYLMRGASRWQWEHCVLPSGQSRSGGKSFILSAH